LKLNISFNIFTVNEHGFDLLTGEIMKIYDTLTKKKQELVPKRNREIGIYLCGPTVYDYGHLGHGRSAIVFDIFRRFLIYKGFKVTFVRNWTDIDDKTIERANKQGKTVKELTEEFIEIYKKDFRDLNILEPDYAPKPTMHMDEIIDLIKKLFENGHAYILTDGVYFDITTFSDYGRLSGQPLEELKSGARVNVSDEKRNPGDFALWKFEKPDEPSWESPWGKGRPGWHIECSAMSVKYLGEKFDIHCGGQDLTFPHHEDEIAQSKGAGFSFARYWMHNGFLNIDNEKMSKSLGNFFALREVFEKYSPLTVRYFLLSAHYRAPLNYSLKTLTQADHTLKRYNDFIQRVSEISKREIPGNDVQNISRLAEEAVEGFDTGLEDDLNISKSLASIAEITKEINILIDSDCLSSTAAKLVLEFFKNVDSVLGVFTFKKDMLPEEIEHLIEERNRARASKDFNRADMIRKELLELGIVLEDTKEGTRWKKMG
jgi:cysteinyl-tRNA synthetase